MSRDILGIDLGTLNSCVAVVRDGHAIVLEEDGRTTVPSCVSFVDDRELVGHAARRQAVTDPAGTLVATKRLLGHPFDSEEVRSACERMSYTIEPSPMGSVLLKALGRELTPVQVAARILHHIRELAHRVLGESVERAVISVPAHFNEVQRRATKLAAEYSGLEVVRLINEPTAAAFAYGYRKGQDFTLAVFDLGGGTFDVTIMNARGDEFEVVATDGDAYLGGEDLDEAVSDWIAEEFLREHGKDPREQEGGRARLKEAAEQAKRDLTEVQETQIELPFLVPLDDGSFPTFERRLTRDKLLELTGPVIQRTLDLCARCLEAAGISTGDIDEVLLVGGQTRMPAVREAVREFFGRPPRRDMNPDEVVAMGAALYAYSLEADKFKEDAEEAAEEAYAVAVKEVKRARKIVEEVEAVQTRTLSEGELADKVQDILAEAEEAFDSEVEHPDADLPRAVEDLREEVFDIQRKLDRVVENAPGSEVEEKPPPIASAVEAVGDWLSRAERASHEAKACLDEAEEHSKARKVNLVDVASHSLGIATAADLFSVLIEKNTRVPAEAVKTFTTHHDNQTEVEIRVFQGEKSRVSANELLGQFLLTGIKPAARLEPSIDVSFRLDEDGILAVQARDGETGTEQGITVTEPLGLQGLEPPGESEED
jgi:molecular chaperone DnaK